MGHVAFVMVVRPGAEPDMREAIGSLLAQDDPAWTVQVVGEGFKPLLPADRRLYSVESQWPSTWEALNLGLMCGLAEDVHKHDDSVSVAEWVAFLDPFDTLDPGYVRAIRTDTESGDLTIFRTSEIAPATMPIGGAIVLRRSFVHEHHIRFKAAGLADPYYHLMADCMEVGARVLLHPLVGYHPLGERA